MKRKKKSKVESISQRKEKKERTRIQPEERTINQEKETRDVRDRRNPKGTRKDSHNRAIR